MTYQVKGSTINSKLGYVEENFGEDARRSIIEAVQSEDLSRILDSSWYPFSTYVELLQLMVQRHLGGDARRLQEVGRYSASKALSTTYRAFRSTASFTAFLSRIASLHYMLYSAGKSEITIGDDERSCVVVLSDKPEVAIEDFHVALGFYLGCGEDYGHRSIHGDFTMGANEARFQLSW